MEENWGMTVAIKFQENIDRHLKLLETQPYIGKTTRQVNAYSILITPHNRVVYKISTKFIYIGFLGNNNRISNHFL
ncbi:MAG: hypothetical protein KF781_09605 [Chitinophagaceae bacterium]|nr:hypothetical protein [Chitinophagaceae bacterium]MCW5905499.1 hypothetical protein [Chitinophagaceae bacterium]